jgi:nucleoid-associated protein YgaU
LRSLIEVSRHIFTRGAARRANSSRGGSAKPKRLRRKIAGLPNRVAVLSKRHLARRKEIALAEAAGISEFPTIRVRQPQLYDIVDDPVKICGIGTGFEGVFSAHVRDAQGAELGDTTIHTSGALGNFQVEIGLQSSPTTSQGTVELFESAPSGSGDELNKVVVLVTFGTALVGNYIGFVEYTVRSGENLSGIAQQFYGDPNKYPVIFEANRDRLIDPNLVFKGQVLRIPQGS